MAIISIEERPSRSSSFGQGYSRKRKRIFRVITDDEEDNEDTVGFAVGVSIGDPFIRFGSGLTDPLCLCVDISADPLEDFPLTWVVTCSYETSASAPFNQPTQNQQPGEGGDADDPTQWAPLKSWSYGTMQLPMRKAFDLDGNNTLTLAVVNSAGYPFKPPPPRNVKYSILTHARYEATFDADLHRQYADAVNAIDEQVFAQLRRVKINPSPVCDDATFLRRASLDLTGLLPSVQTAREFLASIEPNKRSLLINELLASSAFVDFQTLRWADLLRRVFAADVLACARCGGRLRLVDWQVLRIGSDKRTVRTCVPM